MSVIIRLQQLADTACASDIRQLFAGLKIPEGAVHIVGGPEGDAFIGFATDEDARQAMRMDGRKIHDQKIHLLLSSRVEMDTVIARARSGDFETSAIKPQPISPPAIPRGPPPGRGSSPPSRMPPTNSQLRPFNPMPSSYQPADQYGRNAISSVLDQPIPGFGGQRPASIDNQRGGGKDGLWPPSITSTASSSGPFFTGNRPIKSSSPPPPSNFGPSVTLNGSGDSWKAPPQQELAGNRAMPIAAWQDSSLAKAVAAVSGYGSGGGGSVGGAIQQEGNRMPYEHHQITGNDYNEDNKKAAFQGYNASVQPTATPLTNSTFSPPVQDQGNRRMRPSLLPQPGPGERSDYPAAAPPQPSSMMPDYVHAPSPFMQQVNPAAFMQPGPQMSMEVNEDCRYVELSRLPDEMLRPAALEQFLRPTVPLTLSSMKVVFDPQGFPVHTLVRFESPYDAAQALSRNGEQGIRIRPSNRREFNSAIDGSLKTPPSFLAGVTAPPFSDMPMPGPNFGVFREPLSPNLPGLGPSRSSRRSRTPSPPSKRGRHDSGPERFCLEMTNVPFKSNEHDVADYFGPKIKPILVQRSYYEDSRPSDRWIIEIATREEAERASRLHGKLDGRSIRIKKITGAEANRLLLIPDTFGAMRKAQWEDKHGPSIPTVSKQGGIGQRIPGMKALNGTIDEHLGYVDGPPQDPFPPRGGGRGGGRGFGAGRGGGRGRGKHHQGNVLDEPPPQFFASPPSSFSGRPGSGGGPSPPNLNFNNSGSGSGVRSLMDIPIRGRGAPPPRPSAMMSAAAGYSGGPISGPNAIPLKQNAGAPHHNSGKIADVGTIVAVTNAPGGIRDRELLNFLELSKLSTNTVRRSPDGYTIYIDVGADSIATKTAASKNQSYMANSCVQVAKITREQMNAALEATHRQLSSPPTQQEDMDPELVASIGRPGTVIAVHGLPGNVTLDDLVAFFDHYSLREDSVRMHFDDDGHSTGDCLLAVATSQEADKAVKQLSGRRLNGSMVTLSVVQVKG